MPEEDLEEELKRLLSETCGKDASALDPEIDLVNELGLDSLAGLRVLAAVEKRFHIRFPDHRLGEFRTLRQLLEFISRKSP